MLGRFEDPIENSKKFLEITRQTGDKAGEGAAIQNMGNAYGGLGDFQKQLDCSKQYLEIAQQTGNKAGEGSAYTNIGVALFQLQRYAAAEEYYQNAIDANQQL